MKTTQKEVSYGGFFERVREYSIERTAMFGLIRWDEVVHTEKADNDLVLRIRTSKMPDKVFVNGEEYRLVKVLESK